jgi:hypothetical protein
MIYQNLGKVKRKIETLVHVLPSALHRPQRKFLQEILGAVLTKCSLNLTELARGLNEDIKLKGTQKRLQSNVSKNGDLLYISNMRSLCNPAEPIGENTNVYLDLGDITYSKASGYEFMTTVRDGSSKELKQGYLLNMIACRNGGSVFPVYLDVFNRADKGYSSDNTETFNAIEAFMSVHGNKGLWNMDRGYDDKRIMAYIMDRNGQFNIRSNGRRHLDCGGVRKSASDIAHELNRRHKYKHGSYGYKRCRLDNYLVTLIYFKSGNTNLILLTSGHLRAKNVIESRIKAYLSRWGVEECYKFFKQSFGIEKARVTKFESIKCLVGVSMLAWQVLILAAKDDELNAIVQNKAKILIKKDVVFCFYRILKGIQEILKDCKGLFKRKRKEKHEMLSMFDWLDSYERVYVG